MNIQLHIPAGTVVVRRHAMPAPMIDNASGHLRPNFRRINTLISIAGNSTAPKYKKVIITLDSQR